MLVLVYVVSVPLLLYYCLSIGATVVFKLAACPPNTVDCPLG